MHKQDVVAFLGYCGVPPSKVIAYTDWVRAPCPLAPWTHDSGQDSNPSFAIRVDERGESNFNCFACESGDCLRLVELLSSFGAPKPKYNLAKAMEVLANEGTGAACPVTVREYGDYPDEETIPVFPSEWLDTFVQAYKVPRAVQYLESRNMAPHLVAMLDVRYDSRLDCVCFPVRDWLGDLVGMRGRRLLPGDGPSYHMYKYKGQGSSLPWYGEFWLDTERPVLMVESVFDVTSCLRVYDNVCAPLTVGMGREKVKRMSYCLDIVTLFDNGKGGDKARRLVDKHLPDSHITHKFPTAGVSDPGDMTEEELKIVLSDNLFMRKLVI